jgi:hypothetical protein
MNNIHAPHTDEHKHSNMHGTGVMTPLLTHPAPLVVERLDLVIIDDLPASGEEG